MQFTRILGAVIPQVFDSMRYGNGIIGHHYRASRFLQAHDAPCNHMHRPAMEFTLIKSGVLLGLAFSHSSDRRLYCLYASMLLRSQLFEGSSGRTFATLVGTGCNYGLRKEFWLLWAASFANDFKLPMVDHLNEVIAHNRINMSCTEMPG
jgi:hypothetical protein